jgi:hypothetical protein
MSPYPIPLIIHATHEAGLKLGGIGAVLDGVLGSSPYNASVGRTIVVGPVNTWNLFEMERLTAPANRFRFIYSTLHGVSQAPEMVAASFRAIEEQMHVRLIYGVRSFGSFEHEVLLVDAGEIAGSVINPYKYYLWQRWGLPCLQHETNWEFSFYLNAGEPLFAAAEAITAEMSPACERYVVAHDWVGLPLVFSALLRDPKRFKTVFYAHEVATARLLVEENEGHDTRFYNALRLGLACGNTLDQVFGDQSWFYKHVMIQRAGLCDRLFAVGDLGIDELRFLGGAFRDKPIDLVPNGVPADETSIEQRLRSRELMLQYADNLLGYRPDYIFTHVTRMVVSKAMWRDIRVLEHLEWTLAAQGKRAVLFIVSTAVPAGRRGEDVHRWEWEYGWPVGHRADNGDLQGSEASFFFNAVEPFHRGRQAIRLVLVNQFGWNRQCCGWRMPEAMSFGDLRAGTDLEFGQSIYEPFGIAQLEPLVSGAICVVSSVCGCVDFAKCAGAGLSHEEGTKASHNLIVGDYVSLAGGQPLGSAWDALRIDLAMRNHIESERSYSVAQEIARQLPGNNDERRRLLESGQRAAKQMRWETIVKDHFLPALRRC